MSDDEPTLEEFRQKHGQKPATVEMLCAGNDAFMDVLKQHKEVIAALKARVEKLESRPLQKWAGIHIEGVQYAEAFPRDAARLAMGGDLHDDDHARRRGQRLAIDCQAGHGMTLELLEDRLGLLRELATTEHDLAAYEQQHGRSEDTLDLYARLHAVRLTVLEQLRAPRADATTTIH